MPEWMKMTIPGLIKTDTGSVLIIEMEMSIWLSEDRCRKQVKCDEMDDYF